jgi:hypothetical protein
MKLPHTIAGPIILLGTTLLAVGSEGTKAQTSSASEATPTTRPLTELLQGTFHGTVIDADEPVRCVTHFESYRGEVSGRYAVREGAQRYLGTLRGFVLVDAEKRICRFRWKDKHGEGLLTIQVSADGNSFAGSWGKEVIQDELIWTGGREGPATRRSSESDRRKYRP